MEFLKSVGEFVVALGGVTEGLQGSLGGFQVGLLVGSELFVLYGVFQPLQFLLALTGLSPAALWDSSSWRSRMTVWR